MKYKTIEAAKKVADDLKKEIFDKAGEIGQLEEQRKAAEEAAQAAAADGDQNLFYRHKNEAHECADKIEFLTARLERLRQLKVVDREDAAETWAAYTKEYNGKLSHKLEELEQVKAQFLKIYAELLELQAGMLRSREQLNSFTGSETNPANAEGAKAYHAQMIPVKNGAMTRGLLSLGGTSLKDPDACYYLSMIAQQDANCHDLYTHPTFTRTGQILNASVWG